MKQIAEGHRFLAVFALSSLSMGVSVGVAKIVTALYALHPGAGPAQLGLITSGGMVGMLVDSIAEIETVLSPRYGRAAALRMLAMPMGVAVLRALHRIASIASRRESLAAHSNDSVD